MHLAWIDADESSRPRLHLTSPAPRTVSTRVDDAHPILIVNVPRKRVRARGGHGIDSSDRKLVKSNVLAHYIYRISDDHPLCPRRPFAFSASARNKVEHERRGCGGVRLEQQVARVENVGFHSRQSPHP
jgi:hypothetical protein